MVKNVIKGSFLFFLFQKFRIEVEAEGLDRDPLIFELKMGKLWEKSG